MRNVAIVIVCVLANAGAYIAYRNLAVADAAPEQPAATSSTVTPAPPTPIPAQPAPTLTVSPTPAPIATPPPEPPAVAAQPAAKAPPVRKVVKRTPPPKANQSSSKGASEDSLLKMDANPYKRGD